MNPPSETFPAPAEVRPLSSQRALTAAGRLLSLGLPVIWLRSPAQGTRWVRGAAQELPPERRGKSPVAEGWRSQDALEYDTLADMWGAGEPGYNVGIRTGRVAGARVRVIVLDADSAGAVRWVEENLPRTDVQVVTSRKADGTMGRHFYFRAPDAHVGNRVRVALPDGVRLEMEVKGDGGLVVGPSSVHGTGSTYRAPLPWTPERVDSMPTFDPGWFGPAAEWEGGEDPGARGDGPRRPPVYVELSLRRRRARAYLDGCPGTTSGQGSASADCLYFARALVRGLCIPPEEAALVMHQHDWNGRCESAAGEPYPWDPEELLHKCRDAYRLAFEKPYGWLLQEGQGEALPAAVQPAEDPEGAAAGVLGGLAAEAAEEERAAVAWDLDPEEVPADDAARRGWPLTDTGNAERMAARFGEGVRWVEDRGVWMAWDRRRWVIRPTALERASKRTARAIGEEAGPAEERVAAARLRLAGTAEADPARAGAVEEVEAAQRGLDAVRGWQKASESARARAAMVKLLQSEPSVAVGQDSFDRRHFLLNVQNGVLDLRAGAPRPLRPHDRDLMMTKITLVAHDAAAAAPTWERCLDAWTGGDAEVAAFLRRAAGYALTGSVREECLFIFCGLGQNGKSTFLNALASVLGPYAMTAPAGLLLETRTDKASPSQQAGLAALVGARLVIASETDDSAAMSEAQVKAITCRDRISAKRMYEGQFDYVPTHHVFLTTNHKPTITGTDDGIWRRVHLVEWNHRVADADRDNRLAERLVEERAGILAWAARGCREWQERGLDPPAAVLRAGRAYRAEQDTLGGFLEDVFVRDASQRVRKTQVRAAYVAWCEEHGHKHPLGAKRFAQEMDARGVRGGDEMRVNGERMWDGLRFRGAAASARPASEGRVIPFERSGS